MEKKYYTRKELAEYLKVTNNTIYNYYAKSDMPVAFYTGNHPRFDLEEVMEWLKSKSNREKR